MRAGGRWGAGVLAALVATGAFLLLRTGRPPESPGLPAPAAPSVPESGREGIPDSPAGAVPGDSVPERPAPEPPAAAPRILEGRVVGPDGGGREGFRIRAKGAEDAEGVTTAFDGTFRLELPAGEAPVELEAAREGYWVLRSPEPASGFPASGLEFLAVKDFRHFLAKGRVIDRRTGEGVSWTEVTVQAESERAAGGSASSSVERDPPEDGDDPVPDPGDFEVGWRKVRAGSGYGPARPEDPLDRRFRIVAFAPGYRKVVTPWERFADERFDREMVVEVDPVLPAVLEGRVVLADGTAYEGGLTLSLSDEAGSLPDFQGKADREGRFRIEGLPPGEYSAHLSVDRSTGSDEHSMGGLNGTSAAVVLREGEATASDFSLPAMGGFTLRVTEADGTPVKNWAVRLKWRRGEMAGGAVRRFLDLAPGEYALRVWAEGFEEGETKFPVRAGETVPVEVRLARAEESAPKEPGE